MLEHQETSALDEIGCNLFYYKKIHAGDDGTNLFGIYLEMKSQDKVVESAYTGPISEDEKFVRGIIAKLAAGQVTPCCLEEVVDELIA